MRQSGLACVTVPLSGLFTNSTLVSGKLKHPVGTLEDVVVIITLDKPLLSEHQRQMLNPMILTVASAIDMPDNILSFEELKKRHVIH